MMVIRPLNGADFSAARDANLQRPGSARRGADAPPTPAASGAPRQDDPDVVALVSNYVGRIREMDDVRLEKVREAIANMSRPDWDGLETARKAAERMLQQGA
jgi:hypothetical protein